MRILIEEYPYEATAVKDILHGLDALENVEGKVSVHYVGYYYNSRLKDCVFILPKVLLKDVAGRELAFGKYTPESITSLDTHNPLNTEEREFLYGFAVWIYRAIVVYKNSRFTDRDTIYHAQIAQIGNGQRRLSNTYLDILLSLLQFNRDHRSFFFFIIKNIHSGQRKIHWTRTIHRTDAIVQQGQPIYLNPITKRKQINFDEELLVIFFSILNYIGDTYGFPKDIYCQYQLITGARFEKYLNGFGTTRLRQIKYKYFSDTALQLWQLCYAFFDKARQIYVATEQKEYLLVKSFHIVFEAIIDELIGDNPLPDGMDKRQKDGKIVDHLFTAQSLIERDDRPTYYIGDSKYYKMGHEVGEESVYKQYTYARNVIQWNLDIFNNRQSTGSGVQLRDELTEGYNIIPNFFISAKMDALFRYDEDGIAQTNRRTNRHKQVQFTNRLFDRDTLLLFHYDVNFLFVLSLYARNSTQQKTQWKQQMRERFRLEIQEWLQADYNFYAMQPHEDVDGNAYLQSHFKTLLGKVYTPFEDTQIFSLALDKDPQQQAANQELLTELSHAFYIAPCRLGEQPQEALQPIVARGAKPYGGEKTGVLMVMMEDFDKKRNTSFSNGKIAIALKYTQESMDISAHIATIGYIFFHTRGNQQKCHLFAVQGECTILPAEKIPDDRYRNIQKDILFYVAADIDLSRELDASGLDVTKAPYAPKARYDAQYIDIDMLRNGQDHAPLGAHRDE